MILNYAIPQVSNHPLIIRDEEALYPIWENLAGCSFQSTVGMVKVLDPGYRNLYSGPDYRDVILEFEQLGIQMGDVEIHTHLHDWYSHGHSCDRQYSRVILNVILNGAMEPVRLNDVVQVPTAVLGRNILRMKVHKACSGISINPENLESVLKLAARIRFDAMVEKFRPASREVLLQQIIKMIQIRGEEENIRRLILAVNEVSGLFALTIHEKLGRMAYYTRQLKWTMGRKRPGSHPLHRIVLLTLLADKLCSHPELAAEISITSLKSDCSELESCGYLVPGSAFLQELMGNVVLPLRTAINGTEVFSEWYDLPAQRYAVSSKMKKVWEYSGRITFGVQQGILHLHKEHCRFGGCHFCPLMNC